jgi:hypothetical protein
MNTRSYRRNRLALELELAASAARRKINEAVRDEQMAAAAIESAALLELFRTDSAAAWGQLAAMTERQRVNAAIEMACYLESQGKPVAWGDILDCWERKLAARAETEVSETKEVQEITREPLGANAFRWRGRTDTLLRRQANGYAAPSATKVGVTYAVAADGSSCTCPGFQFRGYCRHVRAVQQRVAA